MPAREAVTRRSWMFRGVAAGFAVALGNGCRLQKPSLPQRTFLLQPPKGGPERPEGEPRAGVLLVRPVRVAPAFDARAFVVRRGEAEYAADPYHAFLLSPGPMFTEAFAGWLRGLGVFRDVTTGGSQIAPTHALEAEVTELYGDYRSPEAPKAVLTVQFRFLHPLLGSKTPVVWRRLERQAVGLGRLGVDELVIGWTQALAGVCRALEGGLFSPGLVPSQPQA